MRSGKNVKILIITLIILLLMGVLSQGKTGFVSGGFGLLPLGISSLRASASATPDSADTDELSGLKKENAELKDRLADYLDTKRENERLLKYFGISKQNPGYRLTPAEVTARDPDDDFGSFTIGRGTSDGVKEGDPVITENGLVGQVTRAELLTSRVTTVLSPDIMIGAADKQTNDKGVVRGSALLSDKNQTALTLLAEDNRIKPGDLVTTLGTGGVYPGSLMIGTVSGIGYDPFDSSPHAVLELAEDIRRVESVAVITDFSGRGRVSADGG